MHQSMIGAAALFGLNVGYILHHWPAALLTLLVLYGATFVMVGTPNTNYLFWTPLAYVLGVVGSLYITNVLALPPFVAFDMWFRRPARCWPLPLVAALLAGASAAWALLPRQAWFWAVPWTAVVLSIVVAGVLVRLQAAPSVAIRAYSIWFASATAYCTAAGLLEALAPRRYTAAYVLGTLGTMVAVVRLCSSIAMIRHRIARYHRHWEHALVYIATVNDDASLMHQPGPSGVAFQPHYE